MKTYENLKRWTLPKNYFGAHWCGFYCFLSRHRDSGCLDRANFDAGLKAIKSVVRKESVSEDLWEMATVQVVRENHWAVGWVEWIAIHESDNATLELADSILAKLDNYPVLDENLFSEYEMTEANEAWKNCYRTSERIKYIREHRRQFEFSDFSDLMQCVRGKYFAGYASELIN